MNDDINRLTIDGIVCDDGRPRGLLFIFDSKGDFEIYSVPLDPPPDDPPGALHPDGSRGPPRERKDQS